jgi:hypothetical protein
MTALVFLAIVVVVGVSLAAIMTVWSPGSPQPKKLAAA